MDGTTREDCLGFSPQHLLGSLSLCAGALTSHPPLLVRYRVFALDHKMRPSTDTLTVMVEVSD